MLALDGPWCVGRRPVFFDRNVGSGSFEECNHDHTAGTFSIADTSLKGTQAIDRPFRSEAGKPIYATNYGAVIDDAAGNTTAAAVESWHCVGVISDWIGIEVKLVYDVVVSFGSIRRNTRVASVRAAWG